MTSLRFTLLSEGSSDRALIPVLIWAIQQTAVDAVSPQWSELRSLPNPPKSLADRVTVCLEQYPCDLLFVHRDADREDRETRIREIRAACAAHERPPAVCVVPVRTLEAWFLFNEPAIRRAAGNPNGKVSLALPAWNRVEEVADPKQTLEDVVRAASELPAKRRRRLDVKAAVHRIAELVDDFSPLRQLPAFRAFEAELAEALQGLGSA